jgi:hypothetical protein
MHNSVLQPPKKEDAQAAPIVFTLILSRTIMSIYNVPLIMHLQCGFQF